MCKCILKGRLPECSRRMGDLSRNVLLSGKFRAEVCVYVCKKCMICMEFVFCRAKIYAVEGLKVVFSQTLAICSAKQ